MYSQVAKRAFQPARVWFGVRTGVGLGRGTQASESLYKQIPKKDQFLIETAAFVSKHSSPVNNNKRRSNDKTDGTFVLCALLLFWNMFFFGKNLCLRTLTQTHSQSILQKNAAIFFVVAFQPPRSPIINKMHIYPGHSQTHNQPLIMNHAPIHPFLSSSLPSSLCLARSLRLAQTAPPAPTLPLASPVEERREAEEEASRRARSTSCLMRR